MSGLSGAVGLETGFRESAPGGGVFGESPRVATLAARVSVHGGDTALGAHL